MNVDEIKQAGALAAMRDAVGQRWDNVREDVSKRTPAKIRQHLEEIELLEAEIAKYEGDGSIQLSDLATVELGQLLQGKAIPRTLRAELLSNPSRLGEQWCPLIRKHLNEEPVGFHAVRRALRPRLEEAIGLSNDARVDLRKLLSRSNCPPQSELYKNTMGPTPKLAKEDCPDIQNLLDVYSLEEFPDLRRALRPVRPYEPLIRWLETYANSKIAVCIQGAALKSLKAWRASPRGVRTELEGFLPLDTGETFSVPPSAIDVLVEALLPPKGFKLSPIELRDLRTLLAESPLSDSMARVLESGFATTADLEAIKAKLKPLQPSNLKALRAFVGA